MSATHGRLLVPSSGAATPPFDISVQARLAQRFAAVREQSEHLIRPLSAEDAQIQSMPDASPAKWHLAHTTWFFETFILERFEPQFAPFDPTYRVLYNSYYHGVGEQFPRHQRGLVTHPSLDTVLRYRRQVNQRMQRVLASTTDENLEALVTLGLHHEQQHQELLLTDIKHAFFANLHRGPYAPRQATAPSYAPPLSWIAFDGGVVSQGYDRARDGDFSFDNETPRHRVFLEPFELASRAVTVGEYLEFMNDGGYRRPDLWLSLGWDWVRQMKREAPLYWLAGTEQGRWHQHTLNGLRAVIPDTPMCHLSFFEADAFARWAGARLPTEAEWEHAARSVDSPPFRMANFSHREIYEPTVAPHNESGGLTQLFGDIWEWTSSSYNAYPGFRQAADAIGEYNGKFMCNQYVLRGGSCATPLGHVRATYRNFFPAEASWQFTGVRLARTLEE